MKNLPFFAVWLFTLATAFSRPETQDGKPIDLPYADPAGGRESHQYTDAPVNETRIYDFYQRQAAWYLENPPAESEVLPAFPGLDGGLWGHSGRLPQNQHIDDSWSKMDCGRVIGCTLRGAGKNYLKALTFQFIEDDEPITFVFNPETLAFEKYWWGEVQFGERRWGIVENVYAGEDVQSMEFTPKSGEFLGWFKAGETYFLHTRFEGGELFERLAMKKNGDDRFIVRRLVSREKVEQAIRNAEPDWEWTFEASGKRAKNNRPYVIDEIPIPFENPWNSMMFLAGHDFFSNGDAAVCTIMGDVWIVSGIDEGLKKVTWRRYAAGMNEPLGLEIVDDVIYLLCKDRLWRLHDLNDDGEADWFESFGDFPTSMGAHDYTTDLQRDAEGNFYFSTKHIGTVKMSPDGKTWETLANGLRNPNGIGVRSDGMVVTAPQEGTWTPASMIVESKDGRFFGLGAEKGQSIDPPICYVPRGVDCSTSGHVFVEEENWGPLGGQLLSLSYGYGKHYAVLIDESTGVKQGAAVPLLGDYLAAPNRAKFNPHDSQLYVTGSEGWGDYALEEGCFNRVRFTGKPAYLPVGFKVHSNGIAVRFNQKLDRKTAENPKNWFGQQWNYRYTRGYGSPELSVRQPSIIGHDPVKVASAHLLQDGKTVFVEFPDLLPVMQFHLHGQLKAADGTAFNADLFPTIKRLGKPFQSAPNLSEEAPNKPRDLVLRIQWPEEKKQDGPQLEGGRKVTIKAIAGLQFDKKRIYAKAGERIRLTLDNTDVIPHNLVFGKPGTMEEIGSLANAMITDPKAFDKAYVPEHKGVIAHTAVINGGVKDTVVFDVPEAPGNYPYLCTFPGHWMIMRGVMEVSAPKEKAATPVAKKASKPRAKSKPNIIYILLDDAGYGDFGCYGQELFPTPNIDRLATEGMKFTQHYSGSTVCAPTRCVLMTGVHTGRAYVRGNREVKPEGQAPMPADIVTIPRLLKRKGYATGAFGKWGLGAPGSPSDPSEHFDLFYGVNCQRQAHNFYPTHVWRNKEKVEFSERDVYCHDVIVDEALGFVKDNADGPFFIYFPIMIPHAAMQVPEEYAKPWRKKFPQFEDVIGKYGGSTVTNPIAGFAGMMTKLDEDIGRLLTLLEELGIDENTLVMLSSDNGPHREGGHDPDFFDSNGPLRGFKRDLSEGGVRVPLLARWPGKIHPGSVSDHISAHWDMLPTFCELAGVEVPKRLEIDGITMVPELLGKGNQEAHDYLYWEFFERGGKRAARWGTWKAVQLDVHKDPDGPIAIYNLAKDLGEKKNLADWRPDLELRAKEIFAEAHEPSELWKFGK
ncbi:MAG: sulfatase-like hydrolase/transferase [Verrucomicrobiota bacterium]